MKGTTEGLSAVVIVVLAVAAFMAIAFGIGYLVGKVLF